MISGVLKPEKIVIHSLYICPPHLYIVATLPWEIRKSFFSNIIHIAIEGRYVGSLLDPSLSQRPPHATADNDVFQLKFYSRLNVLSVTKVKMTTTIYDTDDTTTLNSRSKTERQKLRYCDYHSNSDSQL